MTRTELMLNKLSADLRAQLHLNAEVHQSYPVSTVQPSPCTLACPAGVNVKSYLSLIAAGRFQEALEVVRLQNPLPGICGRVCTHPCEDACNRVAIDDPLAIRQLKRFVADNELTQASPGPTLIPRSRDERIAIIGSGPAGLAAANDLIRKGYGVVIYEALQEPGGMMMAGIPEFRLPRDIIHVEINAIKALGVHIKCGHKISGKNAVQKLLDDGFDAVFIAAGAHKGKLAGIPGEKEFQGVIDSVAFMKAVNLGKQPEIGRIVHVIGGGNSALDSARSALRLGTEEVHIIYRRTRNEMPADASEILEAEEEGVHFRFLSAPVKIIGENKKVTGVAYQKMKLGKEDTSGRPRPVPVKGSEFLLPADSVIMAISQEPDLDFLGPDHPLTISRWNTLTVNPNTLATSLPGVFAGGDVVTGPKTIIDAIAQGHVAARSIQQYLTHQSLAATESNGALMELEIESDILNREKHPRTTMPASNPDKRKQNFIEVEQGFDTDSAIAEAQRCFRCGPCWECHICVPECDKRIALITRQNGESDLILRIPRGKSFPENTKAPWSGTVSVRNKKSTALLNSSVPYIVPDLCRSCGDCVSLCEYNAISLNPNGDDHLIAAINEDICRGCGTCIPICSPSAIISHYYTPDWVSNQLNFLSTGDPSITVITCHWNGQAEAGQDKTFSHTNIQFIHLMCSGQITPSMVLQAFKQGTSGVFIAACRERDCHYDFGARQARKTFSQIRQWTHMLGVASNRLEFVQIEKADTVSFMKAIQDFTKGLLLNHTAKRSHRPEPV